MTGKIYFRLTDGNLDPEERLEESALWKAMSDEYGDEIEPITGRKRPLSGFAFGRDLQNLPSCNPVPADLPYWTFDAFLDHCQRQFLVCAYEQADGYVRALHAQGLGAFIKSTRTKHGIFRAPVGTDLAAAMGDMAYSFMDGGPSLMLQELVEVTFEHRFFVIDRQVVTSSPIHPKLTPLDSPFEQGVAWRSPSDAEPSYMSEHMSARARFSFNMLYGIARNIATRMPVAHAAIDCAFINGHAGVVELNPMQLGNLGLYAGDVRALARASRKLLPPID